MRRARIGDHGVVRWSEQCFCPTPLQHERQTVYDRHFIDLQTQEIDDYIASPGEPFLKCQDREAKSKSPCPSREASAEPLSMNSPFAA